MVRRVRERVRDLGLEVLPVSWFEWHNESWRSRKREVGLLHLLKRERKRFDFCGFVAFYVHCIDIALVGSSSQW